jgi:N-acylglucosamine-6-phosphate 2-epimerase
VSCQALPGEPLYGGQMMKYMALAAQRGGAIAIRANGVEDIRDIKSTVDLPVIGLIKREVPGSGIFITPGMEDVRQILDAGADVVALDVTDREDRLNRVTELIEYIHSRGALVMADISVLEEGMEAEKRAVDFVATTLSGYTPYSTQQVEPDIALIKQLSKSLKVPVVAEGRISTPDEAATALKAGADYVVVGGAITRPHLITQRFVNRMSELWWGRG